MMRPSRVLEYIDRAVILAWIVGLCFITHTCAPVAKIMAEGWVTERPMAGTVKGGK